MTQESTVRQSKEAFGYLRCVLCDLLLCLPPGCSYSLEHVRQQRGLVPVGSCLARLYAARHLQGRKQHSRPASCIISTRDPFSAQTLYSELVQITAKQRPVQIVTMDCEFRQFGNNAALLLHGALQ